MISRCSTKSTTMDEGMLQRWVATPENYWHAINISKVIVYSIQLEQHIERILPRKILALPFHGEGTFNLPFLHKWDTVYIPYPRDVHHHHQEPLQQHVSCLLSVLEDNLVRYLQIMYVEKINTVMSPQCQHCWTRDARKSINLDTKEHRLWDDREGVGVCAYTLTRRGWPGCSCRDITSMRCSGGGWSNR